jgi:hypothetical protein
MVGFNEMAHKNMNNPSYFHWRVFFSCKSFTAHRLLRLLHKYAEVGKLLWGAQAFDGSPWTLFGSRRACRQAGGFTEGRGSFTENKNSVKLQKLCGTPCHPKRRRSRCIIPHLRRETMPSNQDVYKRLFTFYFLLFTFYFNLSTSTPLGAAPLTFNLLYFNLSTPHFDVAQCGTQGSAFNL